MNDEIENKVDERTHSISSDIEVGRTQTIDIIEEKDIVKNEAKQSEIEESKPKNIVTEDTGMKVNVTTKGGKEKKNRNTRSFLLGAIVLLILVITIGLIYLKVLDLKEKYKIEKNVESVFDESIERKQSNESNLLVNFGDKYNVNDIKIIQYHDLDGKVTTDSGSSSECNVVRHFCQIDGLKDKVVQDSVNNTIKNVVYSIDAGTNGKLNVYSYVSGNFSNILSITMYYYRDEQKAPTYKNLNFNLCDGSLIQFEDLFINSAPIVSLLTDASMVAKAWKIDLNYESMTDEEYYNKREELYNMNNRDFSNSEDYGIEVANLYKKMKGNIEFAVNPKGVTIYNFNPSFLGDDHRPLTINFRNNIVNIAAYKRFLTTSSIYENDIKPNDVYVFTAIYDGYDNFFFENSGNIYINLYMGQTDDESKNQFLKNEINQKIINEIKIKANANPNKKYVVTGYAYYSDFEYRDYYYDSKDRYRDAYLEHNGVKKIININYYLEVMDNMEDKRFGEIMAAVDSIPSASAEAYPVSTLNENYVIDEYSYLHLPVIDSSRLYEVLYYKDNNSFFNSKGNIPSDQELEKYYYDNELYILGVDYGS